MELREWQYINKPAGSVASNSSSGYKKRFEKLIKYHIDHASSELESVTTKDIKDYSFHLSEHYNTGSQEFDRTIIVSVDKYTDEFYLSIFVDGKVVYQNDYEGYEKVLEILTGSYMFLPDDGTPEYDDLLVEWVAMKNTNSTATIQNASTNNNSSSIAPRFKTNKDKFEYIIEYMTNEDKRLHNATNTVTTRLDNNGFTYKEYRLGGLSLNEEYVVTVDCKYSKTGSWKLIVKSEKDTETKILVDAKGTGFEDLLKKLGIFLSVPDYHISAYFKLIKEELTESAGSMADDFKLYENLWEDVDIEEYNIILGKTSYNLYNDYELESYLTQSAKLMRKPLNTEKPLEFFKLQKVNKMLRTPKYYENKKLAAKLQKVKSELEKKLN